MSKKHANPEEIRYYMKQCDKLITLFSWLLGLFMLLVIGFIEYRPTLSAIFMALAFVSGFIANHFNNYYQLLCNELYLTQLPSKK